MSAAFESAKNALARATMLSYPQADAPIALTTDASDTAVGAVLDQFVNGVWQPLAFFSRQLRAPEQKYSAFDRELLALYLAIRHFRYYLEGRAFTTLHGTERSCVVTALVISTVLAELVILCEEVC